MEDGASRDAVEVALSAREKGRDDRELDAFCDFVKSEDNASELNIVLDECASDGELLTELEVTVMDDPPVDVTEPEKAELTGVHDETVAGMELFEKDLHVNALVDGAKDKPLEVVDDK